MDRYIGLDAHAVSCTLAIVSEASKRLRDCPVETNGAALVSRTGPAAVLAPGLGAGAGGNPEPRLTSLAWRWAGVRPRPPTGAQPCAKISLTVSIATG